MSVLNQEIPYFKYFEDITSIPHGSYNEAGLADYLVEFAKKRNLKYFRDEMHNVIIYKEASKGYEDHEPLMLQGHIDMVNEKNNDSDHDFEKDPLKLYIDENNWLHAKGTTLGADDGVAVAYMLAILDDNTIKHPSLDCVFTVQEEVGLFGAMNIKKENLRAKRLINMDSGNEEVTIVSSSGGSRAIISKEIDFVENKDKTYEIEITGLLGGHSGGCIHLERGNANKILIRILYNMIKENDIKIVKLEGGLKENAIPRESIGIFNSSSDFDKLKESFERIFNDIKAELEFSDKDFVAYFRPSNKAQKAIDNKTSKDLISMIYVLPNGFKNKSMAIEGLTTCSLNLGVMKTEDNKVNCYYSLRSPMTSLRDELADELKEIANIYGATFVRPSDYPGWSYEANSDLRETLRVLIKEYLGKDMVEHATHGGLETGIFKGLIKDLDIVTFMPISKDAHTPKEALNLTSMELCYKILIEFLSRL